MRCCRLPTCLTITMCLLVTPHAWAFNGNRVTTGPLTITIQHLPTVTERDRPQDVLVTLDSTADAGLVVPGSVMASDAFFPFRDGLDNAAAAGIKAVIQPGGSMRDDEVIAAANEHGMTMIFTGRRHFKH